MRLAAVVEETVPRFDGRTVKWIGDGVELYFRKPLNAVRCSLELTRQAPGAQLPDTHIGINAGPLVYEGGDYYGRTVNIAARIAAHAGAGQVFVSGELAACADAPDVRYKQIGPVSFKSVSREVVVLEAKRA